MRKIFGYISAFVVAVMLFVSFASFANAVSYKHYEEISLKKTEYCVGETWKNLTGSSYSWYMDGIRLLTDSSYYYLEYKAKYSGQSSWLPAVKSTDSAEYAGIYGKHMTNVSIKVYNKINGLYDSRDYVVMYRAMSGDKWCAWVSNGTPDAMKVIKEQFSISGELDTSGTDAGDSTQGLINAIQIRIFERCSASAGSGGKIINASYINQMAVGLPNGCEAVSAVMALKYASYSVSVEDFLSKYFQMGETGTDPSVNYVGDPHTSSGWGCYSPVIKKSIDKVIDSKKHVCRDLTGTAVEELCNKYVSRGIPVIVWATTYLQTDGCTYSYWTTPGGKYIKYNNKQHCLLLVGYDSECYYFNDPMTNVAGKSVIGYPRSLFDASYDIMGKQAVAIDVAGASELVLSSLPERTEYLTNEKFSASGLKVTVVFPNGDTKQVDDYKIGTPDMSDAGDKAVKVTWTDATGNTLSKTFTVKIAYSGPMLSDLKASFVSGKGTYEIGQDIGEGDISVSAVFRTNSIGSDGKIVAEDEEKKVTDGFEIEGYDSSTEGVKTLNIKYRDREVQLDVTIVSGHIPGEVYNETEPDCVSYGCKVTLCALCGKEISREPIAPLGHEFSDDYTVDTEPDYKNCGEKSRHCTRCDERCDITSIDKIISDIKGDANGDGFVNMKDILVVRKAVATGDFDIIPEAYFQNADFDGNGKLNVKDILMIRKKVAYGN